MKNILKTFSAILLAAVLFVSSCKKTETSTDITYPAAYVVNGGSNSLSVIDLSTNEVKRTISLTGVSFPHHISVSPDKSKIAVGVPGMDLSGGHAGMLASMPGTFLVLDAKTGNTLKTQNLPLMNHNAAFSPNGTEIWTAQMDSLGKVLVYDATTYALKNTISVGMMPLEVSFSSDGMMAFVVNNMDNTVTAIDANNKTVMTTLNVGMEPVGAWQGANNKMYVDNETDKSVSIINVGSMSVTGTITLGFTPGMVAYNNTNGTVWVTDGDNGKVSIFEYMTGTWMNTKHITTGTGAHGIVFNSDYSKAYVTNQGAGTVSVIDVASKTKTKDIAVGTKPNGIALKY